MADLDEVTNIVTLAFATDPLWSVALARPDGRIDHQGAFWRFMIGGALRYPETWLTEGGEATSVWIPPGEIEMSSEQDDRVREFVFEQLGPTAEKCIELMARFDAAHPRDEPHYYLSFVATHPDHRGYGIGTRLLAQNLAIIDEQHLPAYLESSNPENNDRYRGLGFEPVGAFSYPGHGPEVTTMWRSAR